MRAARDVCRTMALPHSAHQLPLPGVHGQTTARATYTEDMQQDGSVLSLLIGEQVRGELVNCWKTGGHGRGLVNDDGESLGGLSWSWTRSGGGAREGMRVQSIGFLSLYPLDPFGPAQGPSVLPSAGILRHRGPCLRPSFGPSYAPATAGTTTPARESHRPGWRAAWEVQSPLSWESKSWSSGAIPDTPLANSPNMSAFQAL